MTGRRRNGQERVLDYLGRHPEGATCEQIGDALGMVIQTASARCNDLWHAALVKREGDRRATRSGASAFVWRRLGDRGEAGVRPVSRLPLGAPEQRVDGRGSEAGAGSSASVSPR